MQRVLSLTLILILATLALAGPLPQEPTQTQTPTQAAATELTNKDVLDMLKSGLATEIVVAKIKASPGKFDTSVATLAELKSADVPDAVIMAMVGGIVDTPTAASSPIVEVKVPDGTEIEIQLKNNASGEELKVGDVVDFSVVRPVVINGITIFDKDAPARARITTAKKAGHWGHAGKLEWAMQDVQAADGNRVPARFTKRSIGDSKGGTVAVAAVATTVLLGPFGLLWGLKKGKPAIIPAGNRYSAFVSGDSTVKAKPASTP